MRLASRTPLPVAILPACLLWPALVGAQEWTRFRGPNGTGLSKADPNAIPVTWTESDYNWKVKLPGTGQGRLRTDKPGSPVVQVNRVC